MQKSRVRKNEVEGKLLSTRLGAKSTQAFHVNRVRLGIFFSRSQKVEVAYYAFIYQSTARPDVRVTPDPNKGDGVVLCFLGRLSMRIFQRGFETLLTCSRAPGCPFQSGHPRGETFPHALIKRAPFYKCPQCTSAEVALKSEQHQLVS